MKKLNSGLFITIEGLDGTGKSTTERYLKYMLKDAHLDFMFTKEPDASNDVGKSLRNILISPNNHLTKHEQAVIFALNRRWHINKVIKPALKQHKLVISDRYLTSSLAYQGNYQNVNGKVIDTNHIMKLNESIAQTQTCVPNLNVYLWVQPKAEIQRIVGRHGRTDKFDHFDKALENAKNIIHMQKQYHYALRDMHTPYLSINAKDIKGQSLKVSAKKRANKIFKVIQKLIKN